MSSLPHPAPVRCALPSWHRGCRAPARRVRGRRVRYVIGAEPGQVNGMRWRTGRAP
ncbi:tryptophan biosynthesis modulator TrpM [Streptomyces sp. IBSBF 3010]|uniref:tryptophan biosynthesis modulator TrpM n=1 Tax=unclassified Streptomyces TaxID=2593676 RepID=UPI003FA6AFE7